MLIGYARVSTGDQTLALQQDALRQAGCEKICEDQASGIRAARPGLLRVFDIARAGDTVVVWRLDRLGRSLKELIALVERFQAAGVSLRSLQEAIDTGTSSGTLVFHLFAALAEFERNLIRERTCAGLAAARARGRAGGRRKQLDPGRRQLAVQLYQERQHSVAEICRLMGISKPTLYSYVAEFSSSSACPKDIP